MKKRMMSGILLIALALTVLLIFSSIDKKVTGNAIFSLPSAYSCSSTYINSVWSSVFQENADGILTFVYLNQTNADCQIIAFKNKSTEAFILLYDNLHDISSTNETKIHAFRYNLTSSRLNLIVPNLSSASNEPKSYVDSILASINLNLDISSRSMTTLSQAILQSSATFKILPPSLQEDAIGDTYNYVESINWSSLYSHGTRTSIDIYKSKSDDIFIFEEVYRSIVTCVPNWTSVNSSCHSDDSFVSWYNDSMACNIIDPYPNKTFTCDFDANGVIGNASSIFQLNTDLGVYINGNPDIQSNNHSGIELVELKEGNDTKISFYYNFSIPLNLKNVSIRRQSSSSPFGYLLVSGIYNVSKGFYVDRLNSSSNNVCVKDSDVTSISEVTDLCAASDEYLINCPGTTGAYSCSILNGTRYLVLNLYNSAVKEVISTGSTNPSECTPSSSCDEWSNCVNGYQTRVCIDMNYCNGGNVTVESQECLSQMGCVPSWTCTNWTECSKNSSRSRTCTDTNNCFAFEDMPPLEETCEYRSASSIDSSIIFYVILAIIIVLIVAVAIYLVIAFTKKKSAMDELRIDRDVPNEHQL